VIRINLLPVRAARKKENIRRQVSIFFLSILLVLSIMAYGAIHLDRNISALNAKIEDTQKELARYEAINKQVNEIKNQLKKLEARSGIIEMLDQDRTGPVRTMDSLTSLVIAKKMWLTSLTETKGKMDLTGVAVDNKTIADFMKRLEGSPHFRLVDLISSKQIKLEQTKKFKEFQITCQLSSRGPEKEPKTS